MKTPALLLLTVVVAAGAAAGTHVLLPPPAPPPAPPAAPPALPSGLPERIGLLEARIDDLVAALDRLRKEMQEDRARADAALAETVARLDKEKQRADAAEVLMAAYAGDPKAAEPGKRPEMDAFAKEVSKAMKQGIRQEFKKINDLVVNPSPEALERRRRELKMFAAMMGNGAGLDQAQVATFERILNDTDERAREDLRPILQGIEDYRQVDYGKVKKVTDDSFVAQDSKIDAEFPKEKGERLKQQMEPIRNLFGAMLDELQKESTAAPEPK